MVVGRRVVVVVVVGRRVVVEVVVGLRVVVVGLGFSLSNTFLMAFNKGFFPSPQTPLKSSVSTDQAIPPSKPYRKISSL